MRLNHLNSVRMFELNLVINLLEKIITKEKKDIKLLEIGSGAGWQAKKLQELGYKVEAIDLSNSNYVNDRVFNITDYDGINIPFENEKFDVIFSSNVLEHIPQIKDFQHEIQRVLKDDGIAIHLLPSGTWRWWSNITYYADKVKKIFNKIFKKTNNNETNNNCNDYKKRGKRTFFQMLIPSRHGEQGNSMTEIYYFSKYYWLKLFHMTCWEIKLITTNKLFYTGNAFLGYKLTIKLRNHLSYIFGASCNVFVLAKDRK